MELERRNFLRGQFKPSPDVIRSPYAIVEREFISLCERCPDCVLSCEEKILKIDETGYPAISFSRGECTFCGDCVAACKTGALDRAKARRWTNVAAIAQTCLSINAVFCRSCGDHCSEQALSFKIMTGGRSKPLVDEEKCTGCGACVSICPNTSIEMVEGQTPKEGNI